MIGPYSRHMSKKIFSWPEIILLRDQPNYAIRYHSSMALSWKALLEEMEKAPLSIRGLPESFSSCAIIQILQDFFTEKVKF